MLNRELRRAELLSNKNFIWSRSLVLLSVSEWSCSTWWGVGILLLVIRSRTPPQLLLLLWDKTSCRRTLVVSVTGKSRTCVTCFWTTWSSPAAALTLFILNSSSSGHPAGLQPASWRDTKTKVSNGSLSSWFLSLLVCCCVLPTILKWLTLCSTRWRPLSGVFSLSLHL